MDRRLAGLALLAVACLTLVVFPNFRGRPIGGFAVAVDVPPPPQTGQCLTTLSTVPQDDGSQSDPRVVYPTATFGACVSGVLGEVMSVDPRGFPAVPPTISTYTAASAQCEFSEVNYVGSIGPFDLTNPNVPSLAWQASVTIQSVSIGPSSLQRRAGQMWTACIGTTADSARYSGRIADALTKGSLPPTYATCWGSKPASTALRTDSALASCAAPHSVEILGTTQVIDASTTVAQVQRSCVGFAARAMRTADPTRGGELTIQAYSMDGASVMPLSSAELTAGFLGCLATVDPPHQLVGTLIGLGDHAVPITG